jgi:hypothetical protein
LAQADAQYQAQRDAANPQPPVFAGGALTLDAAGPSFADLTGVQPPPALAGAGIAVQGNTVAVSTATGTWLLTVEAGTVGTASELAPEIAPWLRGLGRFLTSPTAAGLSLLFATPNATVQYQDVAGGLRFTTRPGELIGTLERQQPNGDWAGDGKLIRPDEISRSSMLTPEEQARLRGPLITPMPPPAGPSGTILPPLSPQDRELIDGPPTTPAQPQEPIILPGKPMEPQTLDDLIVTSRGFGEAGSAGHKAATWDYYRERGGDWDYDRWSTTYDNNQSRASDAHAAVDGYRETIGWGQREVTVTVEVDGKQEQRRLDIADRSLRKAVEYKTGYQTASPDNLWELKRDAELVKQGWDVQWVFRDRVSEPLAEALRRAGIGVKTGG